MEIKEYKIDDEPVVWTEIIKRAKELGYESDIYQTSVAAGILRKHGHTVERNVPKTDNVEG